MSGRSVDRATPAALQPDLTPNGPRTWRQAASGPPSASYAPWAVPYCVLYPPAPPPVPRSSSADGKAASSRRRGDTDWIGIGALDTGKATACGPKSPRPHLPARGTLLFLGWSMLLGEEPMWIAGMCRRGDFPASTDRV